MNYLAQVCGIAGAIGPDIDTLGEPAAAHKVRDRLLRLRHRGPDGAHLQIGANYAIGQTRLTILGEGEIGQQPARVGETGWLVFNGEIHNYLELADALAAEGVHCDRRCDTYVLAKALQIWGVHAALEKLDGQWAFVYIDAALGVTYLARDSFGQKPLVLRASPGQFHFASEVQALPQGPLTPRREAIDTFLSSGRYPDSMQTFYEEVLQVPAGECWTVQLGTAVISQTYRTTRSSTATNDSFTEATQGLRGRLRESLKQRLRADVPVHLLLSAGKDSGSVLRLLQEEVPRPTCLTYANGTPSDEARDVADWYGKEVELHVARPVADDAFAKRVAALHTCLDAPLASASLLALDALFAKAESQGSRCLLSCQGADEMLGGYHYYSLRGASPAVRLVRQLRLHGLRGSFAARRDAAAASSCLSNMGVTPTPASDADLTGTALREAQVFGPQLRSMLWYEDRIAMQHSVEVRYPFLKQDLVQWLLTLPLNYFVQGLQRKRLLSAAFAKSWPAQLIQERRKRGLPANETGLLYQHVDFVVAGLRAAEALGGYATETAKMRFLKLRSTPAQLGDREAKVIWRTAMLGHWLLQLASRNTGEEG